MLETNVKHCIAMNPNHFATASFSDKTYHLQVTWPKTVNYCSRLNSHKKALIQCKTMNCNETKPFLQ